MIPKDNCIYIWSENDSVRAQCFQSGRRLKMMFLGKLTGNETQINSRVVFWKQSGYEVIIGVPKKEN